MSFRQIKIILLFWSLAQMVSDLEFFLPKVVSSNPKYGEKSADLCRPTF